MDGIDQIQLNFSEGSLLFMNISLSIIMFGVALEIKPEHFRRIFQKPKLVLTGVFCQFFLLPFLTLLLVMALNPHPSLALGMFMVAACPGGNISNFFTLLSKGNVALSVSLSAIATLSAIVMTPFNFNFWGGLYGPTAELLQTIHIDFLEMLKIVLLLLGIPLVLGMWFAYRFPEITAKIVKPIKILSILFFLGFVVAAFAANFDNFINYVGAVFILVLLHNGVALLSGYSVAALLGLEEPDRRCITIETGIQNSGLALILIFNFFDGLGGMGVVAAWWGIWHMVSGLTLATIFTKGKLT